MYQTPAARVGLQAGGRAHPPEQVARIPVVGTWLLVGANFFFLLPLFFAFFYLQQANNNGAWQPGGVRPPQVWLGALALALAALGVATALAGLRRVRSQATLASYANFGRGAAALMVASVVVQIWQLSHAGFGISSGAFASCFFATNVFVTIELAILALWSLSLGNRAGYEAVHPILMPSPESEVEVATPISALAQSYRIFAIFLLAVLVSAWVVTYFF
ncbi:MAG: cytochrome c oxidase subunit 3 [Candidatus Dormibacteria bacterium]